jgi:hypothetical protein
MLRHSLFKYYDQRIWAEKFLDGEMLFRSLAYFRDCEDAVRGDEHEGTSRFLPDGGLQITNQTQGTQFTLAEYAFESTVKADEIFVFCASRRFGADLAKEFNAVVLKLNPMYAEWTHGVSDDQKGLVAFLHGAVWPDCIKQSSCSAGYISDGGDTPPGQPSDSQNIGYSDKFMHKYWHFVDLPYAGSPGEPPKTPNALTEIELLSQAIGTDESENLKSYDVVWLEHLVGDVHQPLHCTSRFTKNHPQGDAGGNYVPFCQNQCKDELHAYWDGLLEDKPSIEEVTQTAERLAPDPSSKPAGADNADPHSWVDDSFGLAQTVVYIPPISTDNDPKTIISPRPDASYKSKALSVAQSQVVLAGYRLSELLNAKLK